MHSAKLVNLVGVFAFLSIQAVGGGAAVLPEMQRTLYNTFNFNDAEFVQAYGLGQLVPGPNMLMVIVLGYRIAGPLGALLAFIAFFLPVSLVAFWVARFLRRHVDSPWVQSFRNAMAPVAIGLMTAGVYSMGKAAVTTWLTAAIAVAVFVLMLRTKVNPAWFVLACAVFGAVLLPKV